MVRVQITGASQGTWNVVCQSPDHNPDSVFNLGYFTTITNPAGDADHYEINHYTSAHIDANGVSTVYICGDVIDGVPVITGVGHPDGSSTDLDFSLTYDHATKKVNSVTDANGNTSCLTYNGLGNLTSVTNARGKTTRFTYDSNGVDLVSAKDASGRTTVSVDYNGYHQPTSIIKDPVLPGQPDGQGLVTTVTYQPWGPPASVTTSNGAVTTYNFDATTKQVTSVAFTPPSMPAVTLGTLTYDSKNRVRTSTDAYGMTQTFEYTDLNKPVKVDYSDGSRQIVDYACCSLPGVVTDRAGRKTYYDYDALKRLIRVQDADGNTLQYDYDKVGNLTQQIDSRGTVTWWKYDTLNRVSKKSYSDGNWESYTYDPAGEVISVRDARGINTGYSYDVVGNLTKVNYNSLTDTAIQYDDLNRPTQMTDATGTTTWGYNNQGQLTSENGPWANDAVSYGYDSFSRRSTLQVNGTDTVTTTYDALGRLDTLTAPSSAGTATGSWNWDYSGNSGIPTQVTLPTAAKTTYTVDTLERLTQVQNLKSDGTTLLSKYIYGFDNVAKKDERVSQTRQLRDSSGTLGAQQAINYTYQGNTGQLAAELSTEATPLLDQSYSYDVVGNRSQSANRSTNNGFGGRGANGLGVVTTYTNNRLNQNTATSNTNPDGTTSTTASVFEVRGGITKITASSGTTYTTYTFDDADHLYSVLVRLKSDNTNVSQTNFYYDGLGRRRRVKEFIWNAATSSFTTTADTLLVYDGMNVVQEKDNLTTGQPVRVCYVWAGAGANIAGLLSRTVKGTPDAHYYYHYDGSGNVVQLTDTSQNVVAAYGYDAYGNLTSSSGGQASQPYRYSTKWCHAATGLYDFGFRFYSPSLGRWMNRDPLLEGGGVNLYAAMGDSPTNCLDAYGLQLEWYEAGLIGVGVFGTIATGGALPVVAIAAGVVAGVALGASKAYFHGNCFDGEDMAGDVVMSFTAGVLAAGAAGLIPAGPVGPADEGIYRFREKSGLPYVGQSGEIPARIARHLSTGKLLPQDVHTVETWEVQGGRLDREIAEQQLIDEMGIDNLANKVNPMGGRRNLMP